MTTMQMTKSKQILKRVPKDAKHEFGITEVTTLPINEPCIVAIGGELTVSPKDANYYASMLERLLSAYDIKNVGIYSACYKFESTNRKQERAQLFRAAGTRVKNLDITKAEYIRDLYNHIILPRILDTNKKRLSDADAMKNMRKIMLFTHCHGAAVTRAFQEMMKSDMQKYGYDKKIIPQIMHGLLVVQHAPVAPVKNSMFNTISFMSASDTYMNFYDDNFFKYAFEHAEDMAPSYFQPENLFATYEFTNQTFGEHQIVGLVPDENLDILTPDGAIIMAAERNTIINGAKSLTSPKSKALTAQNLIAPASSSDAIKPVFKELKQNGDFFLYVMRDDLKEMRKQKSR